ncbi:ArsR/SmtB family transcription factor [Tenggerimyces flavus]|uniref:ArsR/SmtB family transcription factor n=1 Tax=Tenggerimyces flavus TaxID=1708749 RepID=A0ABV7YC04_9ACTN|nr:helix-turn-helix domain-containing protein [Tenggerimyces flavus]MBM7783508.1 DNA-binding transcriptional ArsR family regulator [Tenggerimyces flavus]
MNDEDDVVEVSGPEQHKALGHPMRHRLLYALGEETATISGLAARFDTRKGNIAHHLKVLREAGLVEIAETRTVRGGTEQYYRRVGRKLRYRGHTAVAMQAMAAEIESDPDDPLVLLRHVRLTSEQAAALAEALTTLVDSAEDAGPGADRFGVLVGVYRPRLADD